jgi:methionyl-tRNA synthetase
VQAFHRALEMTWEVVADANRYVDEQAPWALRKSDPARMATVLYVVLETVRHLAVLSQPVMPDATARLLDQLGQGEDRRDFAALAEPLAPGTPLPKPQGVFPRYLDETAA